MGRPNKAYQQRKGNIKLKVQGTSELSPTALCTVPATDAKKDEPRM